MKSLDFVQWFSWNQIHIPNRNQSCIDSFALVWLRCLIFLICSDLHVPLSYSNHHRKSQMNRNYIFILYNVYFTSSSNTFFDHWFPFDFKSKYRKLYRLIWLSAPHQCQSALLLLLLVLLLLKNGIKIPNGSCWIEMMIQYTTIHTFNYAI